MPRLGHKKSRNGCRQCKARHVKCDESKPCSNCARHGVQCSLVTWDGNSPVPPQPITSNAPGPRRVTKKTSEKPRKVPSHPAPATLPIEYVLNPSPAAAIGTSDSGSPHSSADPFPYLTKFVNKGDTIQPNYWVRDLELMHHWTTEAYITLTPRENVQQMWCIVAPKQAILHHFLMHEILAYSALHLAYLQPDQRRPFYALGIHHQDLALRAMRKMIPNMTAENAGALFATASLVTVSVFASTELEAQHSGSSSNSTIEDLLDIFALIQGIDTILSSSSSIVNEGPFALLLGNHTTEVRPQPIFQDLVDRLPAFSSIIECKTFDANTKKQTLDLISSLKSIFDWAMAPRRADRELGLVFIWPIKLTSHTELLRTGHPAALVLLALYTVVLRAAEPFYWFMEGWADRVLNAIVDILEPHWHDVLQLIKAPLAPQEQQQLPSHHSYQNAQLPGS
ncbi:hypothetical protein CC78DRAFT_475690 [Lojkania enalia]|uniref:Zn(2)-C6 fungal-type domain-containing protein n=1 Tax=Lojkania enalia TaxID=147567 RepID=A0A9P4JYQ4_9PLEO|nr:hypothetical protein CC78DRAFT_475690 [Didymosphaeria enalia]